MSNDKPFRQKTLKEMEDEIMAQRRAQTANASPFARAAEIMREREERGPLSFRMATPESIERRRQMQQPQPQPPPQPVRSYGMISSTLLRARTIKAENEKQAKFYSLLEDKYGAVKGNDRSYLEAMEKYHNDKERKEREKAMKSEYQKQQDERLKQERKKREEELFRMEQERQRQQEQYQREQEQRQRYWEQQQQYEREKQRQQEWERYQQHQREQFYARGGPGPSEEPKKNSKSTLSSKYPSPHSKADALSVMGLDPRSTYTSRDIKQAFNKKALLLHPDKNLHNPEEANAQFNQLSIAFKLLKKQNGGSRRKILKHYRSKKNSKIRRTPNRKYKKRSTKKYR